MDLLLGPLQQSMSAPIPNSFGEFELQPFTYDQISSHLKKYLISNNEIQKEFQTLTHSLTTESWSLVGKIQDAIDSCGFRKLAYLPLNLSMIIQVLPDLLKNSKEEKTGDKNISQFRLYQLFTSQAMITTAKKFLASQEDQNEEKVDSLCEKLNKQLQRLALNLNGCPSSLVAENEEEEACREETNGFFKLCSLLRVDDTHADHQISFTHKSYQSFFVATKIIEEIRNQPNKLEKMVLNQKIFNVDAFSISILHFLVDAVNDHIISTSAMIELIQKSRKHGNLLNSQNFPADKSEEKGTEPRCLEQEISNSQEGASHQHGQHTFSIAAANAIMILNTAGYDFSHQNLSEVCIAGANLS